MLRAKQGVPATQHQHQILLHCFAVCLSIQSDFITLLPGHVIRWTADFTLLGRHRQRARCMLLAKQGLPAVSHHGQILW